MNKIRINEARVSQTIHRGLSVYKQTENIGRKTSKLNFLIALFFFNALGS